MSCCLVGRMAVAGALGYVLGSFVGVPVLSWALALALAGVAAVVVLRSRTPCSPAPLPRQRR